MANKFNKNKIVEGLLNQSDESLESMLDREIKRMKDILQSDIPSIYNDFEDYLNDYFPDFSWNQKDAEIEQEYLLNNKEWQDIAEKIKRKYGYDFVKAWSDPIDQSRLNQNQDLFDTKQLADAYKVVLTNADYQELGSDTTREKFKSYFGIPQDADPDYGHHSSWTNLKNRGLKLEQSRLNQGKNDIYTIAVTRRDRTSYSTGTLEELIKKHGYTLEKGKSWEHEKGNKKINKEPKNINALITNLYNAENNAAANGYSGVSFELVDNSENPNYNKNQSMMNQKQGFDENKHMILDNIHATFQSIVTDDIAIIMREIHKLNSTDRIVETITSIQDNLQDIQGMCREFNNMK